MRSACADLKHSSVDRKKSVETCARFYVNGKRNLIFWAGFADLIMNLFLLLFFFKLLVVGGSRIVED